MSRQLDDVGGRHFAHGQRESRSEQPFSIRGGETLEQRHGSWRAKDFNRQRSRWEKAVLPREDQRRKVAMMVDVEMRKRDVRDRLPFDRELGETSRDAAP